MTPLTLLLGDCRETLKTLPDGSVNCCVTSPPYFGLRSYNGGDAELGKEETPEAFVSNLVELFREVRRVLRDDGTVWLNLGDSYVGTGAKGEHKDPKHPEGRNAQKETPTNYRVQGLKSKDLIGIPWRVAFALQADGWYLRQDLIWAKPNAMPESVKDRCTKAHEYIFLLSKSPKYYFDMNAMKEPAIYAGDNRGARGDKRRGTECNSMSGVTGEFRNKRSVWTVTTKPYKGAHFATFPPDLIEPCVLAGCPTDGIILDPFGGSGTTAGVAIKHGRNAVLCELSKEYVHLIPDRISKISGRPTDEFTSVIQEALFADYEV